VVQNGDQEVARVVLRAVGLFESEFGRGMRIRVWKARATCSAYCVRVAPERSSFNWNDSTKRNAEIQCVAVVCDHVRQEALRVESENSADGRVVTEQSIGVGEAMNETLVRIVVSLDNGLDLSEELGEFGPHDGADEGVASGEVFVQGGPARRERGGPPRPWLFAGWESS